MSINSTTDRRTKPCTSCHFLAHAVCAALHKVYVSYVASSMSSPNASQKRNTIEVPGMAEHKFHYVFCCQSSIPFWRILQLSNYDYAYSHTVVSWLRCATAFHCQPRGYSHANRTTLYVKSRYSLVGLQGEWRVHSQHQKCY